MLSLFYVCSLVDPQNIAALGTGKKTAVLEKGGKGSCIQPRKKHIRDLKNQRRYPGGGGIGADDCILSILELD